MVYFAEAESSAPLQTQSPGGSCCSRSHTPVSLLHSSSKKDNISPFIPGYTHIHTHTQLHTFLYIAVSHFSCSTMSDSLQPHGLQHARPPCPSAAPRAYSNSCPLSWRYHPTISSSVIPFSSCPQSFPASRSLQMSQPFTSGGQSTGVSALKSVPPMNTQD